VRRCHVVVAMSVSDGRNWRHLGVRQLRLRRTGRRICFRFCGERELVGRVELASSYVSMRGRQAQGIDAVRQYAGMDWSAACGRWIRVYCSAMTVLTVDVVVHGAKHLSRDGRTGEEVMNVNFLSAVILYRAADDSDSKSRS